MRPFSVVSHLLDGQKQHIVTAVVPISVFEFVQEKLRNLLGCLAHLQLNPNGKEKAASEGRKHEEVVGNLLSKVGEALLESPYAFGVLEDKGVAAEEQKLRAEVKAVVDRTVQAVSFVQELIAHCEQLSLFPERDLAELSEFTVKELATSLVAGEAISKFLVMLSLFSSREKIVEKTSRFEREMKDFFTAGNGQFTRLSHE